MKNTASKIIDQKNKIHKNNKTTEQTQFNFDEKSSSIKLPQINDLADKSSNKTFTFIDLFAGIGGIRLGFESAGFNCVFSSEFDKFAQKTYQENFGESPHGDITLINENDIPKFDILLAGFPCQPFSIAGYREGFHDKKGRGNVFFEIIRIIKDKQPLVIFLENVKNLQTHDNGNTLKVIYQELKNLGYHTTHKVLNALDYGNIPQNRERIYIVAFKNQKYFDKFSFPNKIPLTKKIADCLESKVDSRYYYNGKPLFTKINSEITKKNTLYQWRRKYVRENKNSACPTLTANMGMGGHNVPIILDDFGIRKLTPRECANFQGFSLDYQIPKNLPDSSLYKQFGNSVCVPVISRIAEKIKEAIES